MFCKEDVPIICKVKVFNKKTKTFIETELKDVKRGDIIKLYNEKGKPIIHNFRVILQSLTDAFVNTETNILMINYTDFHFESLGVNVQCS